MRRGRPRRRCRGRPPRKDTVPVDSEAGASPHLATVVAVMNRSPHERRARRHALTTTGLALAMAVLTACAPAGEPSGVEAPDSIRTPFSNEEEAFRAAEATYRAYVDALNQVNLADPATFEHVYEWLTGEALVDESSSLSAMSAERLVVTGHSSVAGFFNDRFDDVIRSVACLDVSQVRLVDAQGRSQVDTARRDVYAMRLELTMSAESATGLAIRASRAVEDSRCS